MNYYIWLASVERGSEHPLAEAIVAYAVEKGVDLLPVESFKAVPGQGVKAFVSGKEVLVGSRQVYAQSRCGH